MLGLSLPQLLAARAGAAAAAGPKVRAKSVILVYLGGGLSHHDSFDPKPEAPAEIRGKYQPIQQRPRAAGGRTAAADGPGDAQADAGPRPARTTTIITRRPPTGCCRAGLARPFGDYPAIGRRGRRMNSAFTGVLPPYVAIPTQSVVHLGTGQKRVPGRPLRVVQDRRPQQAENFKVQDVSPASRWRPAASSGAQSLLAAVDSLARQVQGNDQIATYDEFHAAGGDDDPVARGPSGAFAIGEEHAALRDRYGRSRSAKAACWPGG